jgi:hypothetical protein
MAAVLLLGLHVPAAMAQTEFRDVRDYFAALHESVFDDTTDGLDDAQRKQLLAKGRTEDWRYRRLHGAKAVLTAVNPNSTVTMTVMNLGRQGLQVHIQNEKAETISYWTLQKGGSALERHQPRPAVQAAAAAHHDLRGGSAGAAGKPVDPLAGVPQAVADHVDALAGCRDATGDAGRLKELRCAERQAIDADLRRRHGASAIVKATLDRAAALFGPRQ